MPRGLSRVDSGGKRSEERLSVRLLGELRLERGGDPVALPPSKKTRALLAWLLLEPREHSREHLCGLFWDAPDDLRGALRWSLSRLRPLVDQPGRRRLEADRDRVRFVGGAGFEVDLLRVQALCAHGLEAATLHELEEAVALFRGELLEGLELSEAFRFQAWCTAQREAARRLHGRLLEALCARHEAAPEQALPVARKMVSLDPLDEGAHRRVMSLLLALGRPRDALAQYQACSAALRANFGAQPSTQTEALRRSLGTAPPEVVSAGPARVAIHDATAPTSAATLRAHHLHRLQLHGREVEEAALGAALEPGGAGLFLLLGEPGIGKSSLLDGLAEAARGRGRRVLAGRCYEAEQVRPYGCLLDALGSGGLLEQAGALLGGDLAVLVSPHARSTSGEGAGSRDRLFDAVAALVRNAARAQPLLLVLDDAQWLDEASAALAHYLVRTAGGEGLAVAAAARGGELGDNPHALRLLRALRRDRLLREIPVGPLTPEQVALLLAARSLRADAGEVHRLSNGNPLLALELGRAIEGGRLPAPGGRLAEVLEERLAALEAGLQSVLEWPAALGRGAAPALIAKASARPLADVLGALAALERHGLLRMLPDGAADFVHDLLREAALRRIPAGRRRALHSALAAALWDAPPAARALAAGTVARQALAAGDEPLAVRASVEAAHQAVRVFAGDEALALAARALPLLPALAREERLRAWLALAEVAVLVPRPGSAERVVEDLSRLLLEAEVSGLAEVVSGAFHLLSRAHYRAEDEQAAVRGSIAGAEAARGNPDPLVRARALGQAGRCLVQAETQLDRASGLLSEAAAAAAAAQVVVIDVPLGLGLLHAFRGEDEQSTARLVQAAAAAQEAGDHWRETEALFALCRAALEQRDAAAALRRAAEAAPVAARMQGGHEPALARALEALARLLASQQSAAADPAAEVLLRRACEELRAHEARWRLSQVLLLRADQALHAGALAEARRLVEEARALGPEQVVQMRHGRAHLVLAEVALGEGDHAAARAELALALAAPGPLTARLRARFSAAAAAAREAQPGSPPEAPKPQDQPPAGERS